MGRAPFGGSEIGSRSGRFNLIVSSAYAYHMSQLAIRSKGRSRVYRRYFTGDVSRPAGASKPVQFTLKYRTSSSDSWKWMNENSCLTDGELYFQTNTFSDRLDNYFEDFTSDFAVHSVSSEVPETSLWFLAKPVGRVESNDQSVVTDDVLGLPTEFSRWFALVRIWSPWLAPRHGKYQFAPTEDAILCSFLRSDGLHLVLLAVSGIEDVLTVFKHDGSGRIVVSSKNDSHDSGQARVIVAVGKTFETANAACMYHARKLVSGEEYSSGEMQAELKLAPNDEEKAQWMENWYDGLTYCTWNGLGQDLTEQKIFDALDILDKNNVKITNLIIDDNWQSLDNHGDSQFNRGMTDFDANKQGFPHGLGHAVTTIRDKHPNIQHVAVWHAILGYWGAISPEGSIAKNYKTKVVRKHGIAKGTMTVVDADDAQRMYNDFYEFLLNAGIDAVKTDAQFFLDVLEDAEDRRRFIKAYQDAWTISGLRYFSNKTISCMSQTPQILFHSQLPTNKPRLMVRNSDDFFPEVPTSHPWHIFTNAHNSLFTCHLNILPDWDMFQTYHEYSSFHAAGRCVSGGPICFTDEPGKHDLNLIKEMTAQSPKGKTVILRPSTIGRSLGVYTAYEEERLLKVSTYHGSKGTGTGILGIFNVSQRPLSEFVALHEFPGVETGQQYIVRAHSTGEISGAMKGDDPHALVSLQVEVKGWEILSAFPLRTFTLRGSRGIENGATQVACIGLIGKMTGAAAITSSDVHVEGNGRLRMAVSVKALGVLGKSP